MNKKVKIQACATVANVVCGFDIMGFALDNPNDEFEFELIEGKTDIIIENIDDYQLPTNPNENILGITLKEVQKRYNKPIGFKVISNKKIKPGSGLGSSSASCVAAAKAANYLLDNFFNEKELLEIAIVGESFASGSRHFDNVAPCFYGGFTLIRNNATADIIRLSSPNWWVAVLHPQIEIKTCEARKILPENISLKDAITQWGNVAALTTSILRNDAELLKRSLVDVVVEPHRSKLIPFYNEVKNECLKLGALGGGISGSGPALFFFAENEKLAEQIKYAMQSIYQNTNIDFKTYTSPINNKGTFIIN